MQVGDDLTERVRRLADHGVADGDTECGGPHRTVGPAPLPGAGAEDRARGVGLATAVADLGDHRDQQGTDLLADVLRAERGGGQRRRLGQLAHRDHAQAVQGGQPATRRGARRGRGVERLADRRSGVLVSAEAELDEDSFRPDRRGVFPCRRGVGIQDCQHGVGAR
ncbi:hypothetical protein JNW91_04980 [Micromonospora sp. STR1_7]|uniref:Uncharacterized protein n=1 Tax=Micromonospora parastrephiae TaxID=2806101 RepID=A0ABS1XPT4_9ACTN|nr:hypothetical protein [Micromonospora parastrephiae]MBM0231281.1 hypothetical protein [Micromonospora parastrephiae]